MTVAMTPAVCRLLFACFFCTLWGGQVIAGDTLTPKEIAEKALKVEEPLVRALFNLTDAVWYAGNLTELLSDTSKFKAEFVEGNASDLAQAVKNATEQAEKAKKVLTEEFKGVLTGAADEAEKLLSQLKVLSKTAENICEEAKKTKKENPDAFKMKVQKITKDLEDVMEMTENTLEALARGVQEAEKARNGLSTEPKNGVKPSQRKDTGADGDSGKKGVNSQTGGKDSDTQTPQGTRDGKPSEATQGSNNPDRAHGGAVTAWAQSPLLLLLTAVAYAAVW